MTPQETIRFLKKIKAVCKFTKDEQLLDVCSMAIEALEKQIQRKPHDCDGEIHMGFCPDCGIAVYYENFCANCGQALDWSGEDVPLSQHNQETN